MERKGITTKHQIDEMFQELEEYYTDTQIKKRSTTKRKRLIRSSVYTVVVLMLFTILGNIWMDRSKGEIPSILGYYIFRVESESMNPTLEVGELFLAKKVTQETQLQVGSIITFYDTKERIVTHRIVEIITTEAGEIGYRTKGDNPINGIDPVVLTINDIVAQLITKLSFL